MLFEKMNLKMKVHENDTLRETYVNTYSNISGDAGIDLFVPRTIIIPAKSLGFKIDPEVLVFGRFGTTPPFGLPPLLSTTA